MKIQTLKIHNIASIEDAQIDFDKAPLADDPLFLITGETGSGKTTILNAICLALYNEVPALKSIGTAEEDKEGLRTNNPRQLLRRGTGEAEIELTFIGNDKKHYRAVWRVQRAHKKITGNYQNVVRVLYVKQGVAEVSYTRSGEIESLIQEAIGLTFEQFTRTTMLAQGQFASFMKASDNEKSEILEKLTGTEIYAQIGQRVSVLSKKAENDFNALDNQIKGAVLLGEEDKANMQQRITELTQQINEADELLKTMDAHIAWLVQEANLQATLTEKIAEQQRAESDFKAEGNSLKNAATDLPALTSAVGKITENISLTKDCISRIKHWCQAKKDLEDSERLLEQGVAEQARQQGILSQHSQMKPEIETDYIKKRSFLEGMMRLADHIETMRQRFAEQNVCPLCGSHVEHLHSDEQLNLHLRSAQTEESKAKAALNETINAITRATTALNSLTSTIASHRRMAEQKRQQATQSEEAVSRLCSDYAAEDAINKKEEQLARQEEDLKTAKQQLDMAVKTMKLAQRLAEANAVVNAVNEQIENHAKARPQMDEDATVETLTATRAQKAEERDAANTELVSLSTQLDRDSQLAALQAEKLKNLEKLRKTKDNWNILNKAFGGDEGKKFRNIAQSYILRALLGKANDYLCKLNNRYLLDCEDGSLTINVIDKHQGDAIRNVGLLSGGEGFIVSLALALGLSSISSSNLNVDTLFIDEGFGTLSSDYLETVINTLDRLHQQGGRRVGIISHVEGLKERIPTQIRVLRTGSSSSKIEVISL